MSTSKSTSTTFVDPYAWELKEGQINCLQVSPWFLTQLNRASCQFCWVPHLVAWYCLTVVSFASGEAETWSTFPGSQRNVGPAAFGSRAPRDLLCLFHHLKYNKIMAHQVLSESALSGGEMALLDFATNPTDIQSS